jgi:hypothetical protein
MGPCRRMKPDSMGRERVNAKLAGARAFGSIETLSWPMLVVKQADGGGMAPIDLRQRDIH